jgi:hypothetical protein
MVADTSVTVRLRLSGVADRIFFGSMALVMLVTVFIGFARTYYLMRWTGAPDLSPLVHLHGVVLTSWFLVFFAQTILVSAGRTDVHRVLGAGGAALAVAVVTLGTTVAIIRDHPPIPSLNVRQFLLLPLTIMVLFALFVGLGFRYRRRADHHKRLMLLASLSLLVPAISRWGIPVGLPGPVVGMIVTSVYLLAAWAYDWSRLGRVHPAMQWGGLLLLASMPFRWLFGQTDAWQTVAALLVG